MSRAEIISDIPNCRTPTVGKHGAVWLKLRKTPRRPPIATSAASCILGQQGKIVWAGYPAGAAFERTVDGF